MKNSAAEYLPEPEDTKPEPAAGEDNPPLRLGEFNPLADQVAEVAGTQTGGEPDTGKGGEIASTAGKAPVLRVFSLDEILRYQPPPGSRLVGDGVIELGEIALLFGPPGSYKGFAVGHLMACGARGHGEWLGLQVNAPFASLWVNCENGQRRLRDQFQKMGLPSEAYPFIHVTDIPAVWDLSNPQLAAAIRQTIVAKNIRLVIIDTVSNFTADEFAKEFAAFFASLNSMLHGLEPKPAVLLIHHSRKPKESDKGGRGLLNLISGHQTLQRRARSICYIGRVSDEFDENRVAAVWLKVSNNGKAEGCKTALQLAKDGTLEKVKDFDWSQWQGASGGGAQREPKVNEGHIREVFDFGKARLIHKHAKERLEEIAGVKHAAAYDGLKRFSHMWEKDPGTGLLSLRKEYCNADDAEVGERQ